MREEDFVAPKLEKMFLESLRGLKDAGDSGMVLYPAVGVTVSDSLAYGAFGEPGLRGLIGEVTFSLPPLERMASERDEDLGIFLRGFWGVSQG